MLCRCSLRGWVEELSEYLAGSGMFTLLTNFAVAPTVYRRPLTITPDMVVVKVGSRQWKQPNCLMTLCRWQNMIAPTLRAVRSPSGWNQLKSSRFHRMASEETFDTQTILWREREKL